MRKSQQISALERHFNKTLPEIVAEAYTSHQTAEAAAEALTRESGITVNPNTFGFWLNRLPIRVTKVATVRPAA